MEATLEKETVMNESSINESVQGRSEKWSDAQVDALTRTLVQTSIDSVIDGNLENTYVSMATSSMKEGKVSEAQVWAMLAAVDQLTLLNRSMGVMQQMMAVTSSQRIMPASAMPQSKIIK